MGRRQRALLQEKTTQSPPTSQSQRYERKEPKSSPGLWAFSFGRETQLLLWLPQRNSSLKMAKIRDGSLPTEA
ncbi:hypothetical protein RRG08_011766 [Elysia crispata]|uniref:Uncharacterized protein n=1 Tax=Elysia crispata TaxID=231223 RepID=A0AAE0ZRN3_9GAST|nr:hypothetical protein RRG08_011766 [Elysia crispata]